MSTINQIIEGTYNNITNKNEQMFVDRIKICRECPLIKRDSIFGEICNPSLYCNPKTNETSNKPRLGFYNGCGCVLRSKTRVQDAKCPLHKW